jgi:hypothetical protein
MISAKKMDGGYINDDEWKKSLKPEKPTHGTDPRLN